MIELKQRTIKEFEEIQVNWNDLDSIEAAERKKERLESEGYNLIETTNGFFKSNMVYMRRKKMNIPTTQN